MFQMVDGYSVRRIRERLREEARIEEREKALKEKIKIVKNLIKLGLSNSQISEATDFTMS